MEEKNNFSSPLYDHHVTFNLGVHTDVYKELANKNVSKKKKADDIEMLKEIGIMKEVIQSNGNNIIEKIDNTIQSWNERKDNSNETLCNNNNFLRYKLRYKY